MIQKKSTVSVGGVFSSIKSETTIDIENCSPKELENFIIGMYQNGEISLKDTLAFRPLDFKTLTDDLGLDSSKINLKYFSKLWDNPNTKRNLHKAYKSALHQMLIDGDRNIIMMKNAIKLFEKMKNQKSLSVSYKSTLTQV
jgi:hypothetical protein